MKQFVAHYLHDYLQDLGISINGCLYRNGSLLPHGTKRLPIYQSQQTIDVAIPTPTCK